MPIFGKFRINSGDGSVYVHPKHEDRQSTTTATATTTASSTSVAVNQTPPAGTTTTSLNVTGVNDGIGVGVFEQSTSSGNNQFTLAFRSLVAGNGVSIVQNGNEIMISVAGAATFYTFLLEDGSGSLLLEDGSGYLIQES